MLKLDLTPVPGSATHIRAKLRNTSSQAIRFLYWNTIFDPLCPMGLRLDGGALPSAPYRGPRAKYAFDPQSSLISVPAGGSIERDVDVSLNYRLPAAAAYTVAFEGSLRGVIGDAIAEAAMDAPCKLVALEVDASDWEYHLTPVSNEHLFPAAFASPESGSPGCDVPICWNSYYEPPLNCVMGRARHGQARVEGGTDAQKAVVRRAVYRLFHHIAPRGPYRLEVKDDVEYRRWFGPYTEVRAATVRRAVSEIRGQSVCKSFVIYILPGCVEPDTVAVFRKPDGEDRYAALGLCRPYFREGESGRDSQAGTLAHELSHGYTDTLDHEYGVTCCLRLAASCPDLAVNNADSIQYYLEDALLSRPLVEDEQASTHNEQET